MYMVQSSCPLYSLSFRFCVLMQHLSIKLLLKSLPDGVHIDAQIQICTLRFVRDYEQTDNTWMHRRVNVKEINTRFQNISMRHWISPEHGEEDIQKLLEQLFIRHDFIELLQEASAVYQNKIKNGVTGITWRLEMTINMR